MSDRPDRPTLSHNPRDTTKHPLTSDDGSAVPYGTANTVPSEVNPQVRAGVPCPPSIEGLPNGTAAPQGVGPALVSGWRCWTCAGVLVVGAKGWFICQNDSSHTPPPQPEHSDDLPRVMDVERCRSCGCTDVDCSSCVERTGEACRWVEADLCSACVSAAVSS